MFKESSSKLVPNHLQGSREEQYIKPSKVRARVKVSSSMAQKNVLADKTNTLPSLQNSIEPTSIQINSYPSEKDCDIDSATADQNKQPIELKQLKDNCDPPKNLQKETLSKNNQEMKINRLDNKENVQKCENKVEPSKNKKSMLFNFDFEDSQTDQSQEDQKQLEQKKSKDFKKVSKMQKKEQIDNIFEQDSLFTNRITKFDLDLSSQSENEEKQVKEQAEQKKSKTQKKVKLVLQKFQSQSQEDCGQEGFEQNRKEDDDLVEEDLEVVRNLNFQRLKNHSEYIKVNSNFVSFFPIPPQTKTSLIIKRDTERSQYIVFDGELVSQVLKIEKCLGGNYKFFIVEDNTQNKNKPQWKQIAKMKSNFVGTQFHCYALKDDKKSDEKYQAISITYEVNIFGLNGPRKIKMYAPTQPIPEKKPILQIFEGKKQGGELIKVYQSKTPKWMPDLNAYVLNMKGTASHSSIKNCIIVDSLNENREFLIFGKKSKDIFNLEIKHPLTILQGVAFAVSSFEKKLACE